MQVSMDAGIVANIYNLYKLYTDRVGAATPDDAEKVPYTDPYTDHIYIYIRIRI